MTTERALPLTAEEEAKIKARADAATLGPWCAESMGEKGDGANMIGVAYGPGDEACEHPLSGWLRPYDDAGEEIDYYRDEEVAVCEHRNRNAGYDAIFIAHACEDISRLLASLAAERERADAAWRCFHCGEIFTDRDAAADHFGVQIDGVADEVACKLNATEGLIVKMLREAQEELSRYHTEDNAAFCEFHALGAKHAIALRHEEERGYERGLADFHAAEVRAEAAEAARDRAVGALREMLAQAEGCWVNHYGDNPEGGPEPQHIANARAALAEPRAGGETP